MIAKYIIVLVIAFGLIGGILLVVIEKGDRKAVQAHGPAPQASKPYNILDYTK